MKILYNPMGGVLATVILAASLTASLVATAENQSGSRASEENTAPDRDRSKDQDREMDQDQDLMKDQDRDRMMDRDQMQTHLQTMEQLNDRIQQTRDFGDRQALMDQYRDQIRQSMQLMNQAGSIAGWDEEERIRQLEQNQQMMLQMIQHMWQFQELQR